MLLFTGILAVDYSVNGLINEEGGITILRLERDGQAHVSLHFLNRVLGVDTHYLQRDLEALRKILLDLLK